jgi:NosR/NirI family nitrous oxide reductase transcriptional regulator
MSTLATMPVLPWRKLVMTAVVAAAFAWFWINGPLDEPQPVFEFEERMTGFAEPVKLGEEYQTPITGMVPPREEHAYYHVMAAREPARPTWGIIGDARTNPGLTEEVARLVYDGALAVALNPDGVTLKSGLDLYYTEERDANGRVVQLYLENTGLNKDVKGYAGPIDIGLAVAPDGHIRSVRHLRSMETTSYLKDIEKDGFYDQFEHMVLDDQSHEVDAVTGASLTTEGFARSVTQLVSVARESPLEIYLDTKPEGFDVRAVLPDTWIIDAVLIGLLFVLASLRRVRRSPRAMLGLAIACIVYLGFLRNNSFTYVTYLQPFMGVKWSSVLGVYAAAVLLGAIWDGNSYCRYICPYGNVQRLLLRVIPWHVRLPVSNRVLSAVRWLIALALMIGIFSGLRDWGSYELFPDLFGLQVLESPWFWLSLAVVLASAYFPMLWCRVLCPTGAVLDTVTLLARPRPAARRGLLSGIPVTVEPALN